MRRNMRRVLSRSFRKFGPPVQIGIAQWANEYRWLSPLETARPGQYRHQLTPYLRGILAALDDPAVFTIVGQKSAQVAWTSGVAGNAIGKWIDTDPSPILMLFPKEGAAKEYMAEKFEPMVEATPRLRAKIDLRSRRAQQRQLFKRFPGGFLKLVGSNSPASVKSTPVPRIIVEEPDDCNLNLRGQGDSIKLAEERVKTYRRYKLIVGGTPTLAGLSTVAAKMEMSDKRYFQVECHECGDRHALSFEHFRCDPDDNYSHPIYGNRDPETSYYCCPGCGVVWDDDQKNRNIRVSDELAEQGVDGVGWVATAEFKGTAGFYLNELYSPFPGSHFNKLMAKWLEAQYYADRGDYSKLITFTNSSMGLCYEFKSDAPDAEALAARASDYPEKSVPRGGVILTAGVDVQHDRLAVVIRAWGRGEESWLVFWGELHGNTVDKNDIVWEELDKLLFASFRSEAGSMLRIAAVSIDSSDGNTSDAVYHYARKRQRNGVMAIKGASIDNVDREIFSKPKQSIDTVSNNTKASKYGLKPYIVGTHKAKLLIDGRIRMEGAGPGRMHSYRAVRPDYYEHLTNEVLAPHPKNPNKKVWQCKAGKRNEALDCEVYALHAARSQRVHLMNDVQWTALEGRLIQGDLLNSDGLDESPVPAAPAAPARAVRMRMGR